MNKMATARLDLTNCDREPIHTPGLIQDFGALIAVTSDFIVVHMSLNCSEMLDLAKPLEVGARLADHLSADALDLLRQRLAQAADTDMVERVFGVDLVGDRRLFDCALHLSGRLLVIEAEPHEPGSMSYHNASLRPMARRLEQTEGVGDLCHQAARHLKRLIGFDRVMVYRFHPDLSGEVIAEARESHLEPFLALRYPRTDIPDQARQLYLANPFRIIADVNAEPVPIVPERGIDSGELDLSMSVLRAVSPIHIEYLKNMGVGASLSISIVIKGQLWGLFACHHYCARHVPYSLRTLAELFGEIFSLHLEIAIAEAGSLMNSRARALHDRLMTRLAGGGPLVDNLSTIAETIGDIIPHSGFSALAEERYEARGHAPDKEEFAAIVPSLNTGSAGQIIASEALGEQIPQANAFADKAIGALVIPVSRRPRDYVVLWRQELVRTVTWAGNPQKLLEPGPNGDRLTPRKSFAAWQESVGGRSAPWTDEELAVAESLRVTLLEVILRLTDEQVQERARAAERQELLIAELNHRVRNILTLIRGLVSQSKAEARDATHLSDLVGERIRALALAHDNLTKQRWSPASLHALIMAEAEAYLGGKTSRVKLAGKDALIAPDGYTVLALVLHEMMTNSAKYGALCDSTGRLEIQTAIDERGNLDIAWREHGGPPVKAPERRGFGTTVIERSIPHELKGRAELRYQLGGVEADFVIPARLVSENREKPAMQAADREPGRQATRLDNGSETTPSRETIARALVVEDSMIIAMDTEDHLLGLGVNKVVVASSVASALDEIAGGPSFDLALLDFNLGNETSVMVAEKLAELDVPFWFVTGYGDAIDKTAGSKARGVLKKPFTLAELEQAVDELRS